MIQCKFCKLIFQEQIPDENFSEHLYENIIDQKDSYNKKENFEKKYYRKLIYEINLLKGIFKKRFKDISVLEFGAGWGFWSNYLKDNHFNVYAFEVSKSRIKNLEKNKINIVTDIESTNKKFDFIYSEETFEHIPKPRKDCAHPLEHINCFNKKSFISMLKNTDLKIINYKSKYNYYIINFFKDLKNFAFFDSVLIKKNNK